MDGRWTALPPMACSMPTVPPGRSSGWAQPAARPEAEGGTEVLGPIGTTIVALLALFLGAALAYGALYVLRYLLKWHVRREFKRKEEKAGRSEGKDSVAALGDARRAAPRGVREEFGGFWCLSGRRTVSTPGEILSKNGPEPASFPRRRPARPTC